MINVRRHYYLKIVPVALESDIIVIRLQRRKLGSEKL